MKGNHEEPSRMRRGGSLYCPTGVDSLDFLAGSHETSEGSLLDLLLGGSHDHSVGSHVREGDVCNLRMMTMGIHYKRTIKEQMMLVNIEI